MKLTLLAPQTALSICFALVGIGHVTALWFSLYRIATLSMIGAVVVAQLSASIRPVRSSGMRKALVQASPIYLYALLSTTWSPQPADAFFDVLYVCAAVAPSIALGVTLGRRYDGVKISQGMGVLLIPFAAQAAYGALLGQDPMLVGDGTMRSLLGSAICLVSPVLAGAWALTRQRRFAVFGLIAAIFAITMESRSVVLFAGPAAMASLFLYNRGWALRLLKRWTLPALIVLTIASPGMLSRFDSSATSLEVGESVLEDLALPTNERVDFDRRLTTFTAVQTFVSSPIFGGGYSSLFQTHRSEYGIELSAHGLVPGTLSELGLVGVLVIALVVWRVLRQAMRSVRQERSRDPMTIHFIVGFCALLLLGFFHQTIESVFFGLTLGLLIGLCSPAKTRRITHRPPRQAAAVGATRS